MRSLLAGIAGVSLFLALTGVTGATLPGLEAVEAPGSPGASVLPGAAASRPPQDADQRSVQDGVFSAGQVERGREVFDATCFECHLVEDFQGPFLTSWEGATVYGLFEQLRTTMPYETPGTLEQQAYADVLAYIFQANGLPTGDVELEPEQGSLERIVIEGPFGEPEGGR